MKHIVFNEKAIEFFNNEKTKALDDIAVTIVHKDTLEEKDKEIERLHSIIKEAREYIEEHRIQNKYSFEYDLFQRNTRVSELLEILDKGNK